MAGGYRQPDRTPPRLDRVRRIERGFAFIPNRFLRDGFFCSLSHAERSLYLFLILAADRNGVSFYGYERICSFLEITPDEYLLLRNSLIAKDLIAFDGTRFQVLELPSVPVTAPQRALVTSHDFEEHDSATIRDIIRSSLQPRR
jgi:hypothetical protein